MVILACWVEQAPATQPRGAGKAPLELLGAGQVCPINLPVTLCDAFLASDRAIIRTGMVKGWVTVNLAHTWAIFTAHGNAKRD